MKGWRAAISHECQFRNVGSRRKLSSKRLENRTLKSYVVHIEQRGYFVRWLIADSIGAISMALQMAQAINQEHARYP
jgi:hypothetical protein